MVCGSVLYKINVWVQKGSNGAVSAILFNPFIFQQIGLVLNWRELNMSYQL